MAKPRPDSGGGEREEELLRINAELAAEIRSLRAKRTLEPRSAAGPSARRVSRLLAERDAMASERDSLAAELEASRGEIEGLRRHSEGIGLRVQDQARQIDELSHEVNRLRGGSAGVLRRFRARLLRR